MISHFVYHVKKLPQVVGVKYNELHNSNDKGWIVIDVSKHISHGVLSLSE